jgi:hypothetical protein
MARFMRKGKSKVYWVLTISNKSAPSTAEITAGTALQASIAEINGFTFQNNPIDVPDMGSAFVSKIMGEDTVEDSNIVFYEDDTATTIPTALAKGTAGHIVIFYKGTAGASPAASDKCEVWPVTVSSQARLYTTGNEAAQYRVSFANTGEPVAGTLT